MLSYSCSFCVLAGRNWTEDETQEAIQLFLEEIVESIQTPRDERTKLPLPLVRERMVEAVLCRRYTTLQVRDRMWTVATHPEDYFDWE